MDRGDLEMQPLSELGEPAPQQPTFKFGSTLDGFNFGSDLNGFKFGLPLNEVKEEKECETHSRTMLTSMQRLRSDGNFCDVAIESGEMKLRAHRNVLASATVYFEKMFLHDTKESETGVVNFVDIPSGIVRLCIDYIYTGKVTITTENAKNLLNASEMMQLGELTELCVKFLVDHMDLKNCAEVISLAYLYNKESFDSAIATFLSMKFEEFVVTTNYKSLDYGAVAHCLQLLEGGIVQEKLKWKAILTWINHDCEKRRDYFPKLFILLDLSCLPRDFIEEKIYSESLVTESNECLRMVSTLAFSENKIPRSEKRQQRMSHIIACNRTTRLFHQFNIETKIWSKVTRFPGNFPQNMDMISHNGSLFIGTGDKMHVFSNGSWKCVKIKASTTQIGFGGPEVQFNASISSQPKSSPVNSLSTKGSGLFGSSEASSEFGGFVFHPSFKSKSGFSSSNATTTGPRSSIAPNTHPIQSSYNRCVVIGSTVYMVTTNSLLEYDIPKAELLSQDIATGLGVGFFITISGDKIYMMGGQGSERTAREISLSSKIVEPMSDMIKGRCNGHAFSLNGRVYAVGGCSPADIECYFPNTDQWNVVPNIDIHCNATKVHLGDKLYIIGGEMDKKYEEIDLEKLEIDENAEANVDMNLSCPVFS